MNRMDLNEATNTNGMAIKLGKIFKIKMLAIFIRLKEHALLRSCCLHFFKFFFNIEKERHGK